MKKRRGCLICCILLLCGLLSGCAGLVDGIADINQLEESQEKETEQRKDEEEDTDEESLREYITAYEKIVNAKGEYAAGYFVLVKTKESGIPYLLSLSDSGIIFYHYENKKIVENRFVVATFFYDGVLTENGKIAFYEQLRGDDEEKFYYICNYKNGDVEKDEDGFVKTTSISKKEYEKYKKDGICLDYESFGDNKTFGEIYEDMVRWDFRSSNDWLEDIMNPEDETEQEVLDDSDESTEIEDWDESTENEYWDENTEVEDWDESTEIQDSVEITEPESPKSYDVEAEVKQIREWYYGTQENLDNLLEAGYGDDITAYFDGAYAAKVVVPSGYNGDSATREYFFKDKKLYFAFVVDGKDEYRFYFKDGDMIRYIPPTGTVYNYGDSNLEVVFPRAEALLKEAVELEAGMVNCGS